MPEPMPLLIREFIRNESETWAREEKLETANQLYAQYGDWSKVMMALSVGDS